MERRFGAQSGIDRVHGRERERSINQTFANAPVFSDGRRKMIMIKDGYLLGTKKLTWNRGG